MKKPSPIKIVAAAIAFVLIGAAAFAVTRSAKKQKEKEYYESYKNTALYVGSYEVRFDMYRFFYLKYRSALSKTYSDKAELDRKTRERTEKALCGLYAEIALAEDHGIGIDDADVRLSAAEYIDAVKAYYTEKNKSFASELTSNYMTEDVFEFLVRSDELEDKLFERLVNVEGVVTSDREKLSEMFAGDEFVRVKNVFIENDRGESKDENRKIAEEALARYKSGDSFEVLVKLYSEDTSMPENGYYFTHLEMLEELESVAFSLSDGEVSDVIETADGYYILLRLEKDIAYMEENFERFKEQYQNSAFYRLCNKRGERLSVREAEYLKKLSASDIH